MLVHKGSLYVASKSFTETEKESFRHDVFSEALRIRSSLIAGKESTGKLAQHLDSCGIPREEIVGIEHLVVLKDPARVLRRRQKQVRTVLQEQANQKIGEFVMLKDWPGHHPSSRNIPRHKQEAELKISSVHNHFVELC